MHTHIYTHAVSLWSSRPARVKSGTIKGSVLKQRNPVPRCCDFVANSGSQVTNMDNNPLCGWECLSGDLMLSISLPRAWIPTVLKAKKCTCGRTCNELWFILEVQDCYISWELVQKTIFWKHPLTSRELDGSGLELAAHVPTCALCYVWAMNYSKYLFTGSMLLWKYQLWMSSNVMIEYSHRPQMSHTKTKKKEKKKEAFNTRKHEQRLDVVSLQVSFYWCTLTITMMV